MLKIAIISNATKDIEMKTAMSVAEFLNGKAQVFMCEENRLPSDFGVTYVSYEDLWARVELAIVIGGDGTLLRVASTCAKCSIPALGINLGTVGFLTEVEVSDIENALNAVLNGNYIKEKRMLLKVSINDEDISYHALNDTVIAKHDGVKIIDLDLYTGDELVYHYRADGLIIATPTGSTGYSISAGGPVVDPIMDLYIATPVCAHMLLARSAILPALRETIIRITKEKASAGVTTDGERQRIITAEDELHISKSDYEFELIKIGKNSFYNTLKSKLS